MPRLKSTGKCNFCGHVYEKSGLSRHLKTCKARQDAIAKKRGKPAQNFHIQVEGYYHPVYWMHLEMSGESTLYDLDQFLRDVWLECCGHLSEFTINHKNYSIDAGMDYDSVVEDMEMPTFDPPQFLPGAQDALKKQFGEEGSEEIMSLFQSLFANPLGWMDDFDDNLSMNIKLKEVLTPKLKFRHIYDFGTSTELALKVVDVREGKPLTTKREPVFVMSRNDPPPLVCEVCGEPATQVCTQCIWEGTGWVCDKHTAQHEEDYLLPVVNSPRVGMCGYTGDVEFF